MTGTARRRISAAVALGAAVAFSVGMSTSGASAATTQYVKIVHLCKAARADHATCFALRKETVAKGTPGAVALTRPNTVYPTGPAGGYTPGDLAKAYGVNAGLATSQKVFIVDAYDDPNARADLNTFDAHYGLPAETATSFKKVAQNGSTTYPSANAGWAGEESLDLDAVRGICHACSITLVEANSNAFTDFAKAENEAVNLGANIISNSYGGAESGAIPTTVSSAYNHAKVVIVASTGDNGMYDWDGINEGGTSSNAPEIPSSLNTTVAVGGTALYLNGDGTRSGETVWNENGPGDIDGGNLGYSFGATGGGCSTQVAAQPWQTSVAGWTATTCVKKRLAADIAALADPYTGYDVYDSYKSSGWQTIGGTSLASPLIAGMWALAGGSGGVTYPAQSLYQHLAGDSTPSFYDVTTGGNGACDGTPAGSCASLFGAPPNTLGFGTIDCAWKPNSATLAAGRRECDAATGYDGPSGVGTPKGLAGFKKFTA